MTQATLAPQNLDAEENVLGAILLSGNALDAAAEIVGPGDFYRHSHGIIFRAACTLAERSEPIDVITLREELTRTGELEKAGGYARLHELAGLVPATANVGHYAKIVKENAGLRALQQAGLAIHGLAIERPGTLEELLDKAEAALSKAVAPTITTQFESLGSTLDTVTADIKYAIVNKQPRMGLETGFTDLDQLLTGLHPGQLILVAARPGIGKSALAQNIGENVADAGKHVAFVSLEMSKYELAIRALSRASKLDSKLIRTGRLDDEQVKTLGRGVKEVKNREPCFHVEDNTAITTTTLRAEIRRLHRQTPLSLIVVDYLQLMLASKSEDSRQNEVAAISRSLKLLARELEIPIIAISQLNRQLELRQDKRPQLADLRDSGALEQDADVVLFLYRDEMYNPESSEKGTAEVICAKNRMGERGTVKLAYISKSTRFENLAKGVAP